MSDEAEYYAEPGVMTRLDGLDAALAGMPTDPAGIAETVQGLLVHPFWAHAYGVEVTAERAADLRTRPASAMIDRILEIDPRPLADPREPRDRFVGNCRHFSTLAVALLRRAHVPSRARCGFGNYFEPGKWIDHWIVEHWDGTRWVTLDAQLDARQRAALAFTADPTDLPPGMFLPAGAAWLRCRAGAEDGNRFGILDMWGQWFIIGNVARDLAALNKVEMLPVDGWGDLGTGGAPGGDEYVDAVATLTVSDDHHAIRERYESDPALRAPPRVISYFPGDPAEVDVPELA